jgi:hypothetical protein
MIICSPQASASTGHFTAPARPTSLEGLRVGLFDNTKAPVDTMMAHIAGRLAQRHPGVRSFYASKKHPSLPADAGVLRDLREHCDVVITALGD